MANIALFIVAIYLIASGTAIGCGVIVLVCMIVHEVL